MIKTVLSLFTALFLLTSCMKSLKPTNFSKTTQEPQEVLSNPQTQTSNHYNEKYKLYEVLATDTIVSVAKKNHIPPADLIKYNSIKKPYFLKPGEMLKIPQFKSEDENLIEAVDSLRKRPQGTGTHIQISPKATQ